MDKELLKRAWKIMGIEDPDLEKEASGPAPKDPPTVVVEDKSEDIEADIEVDMGPDLDALRLLDRAEEWGRRDPRPVQLSQAETVVDMTLFVQGLRRDLEAGPGGPRARYGALKADLKALKLIVN